MPEKPENLGFAHTIKNGKGSGLSIDRYRKLQCIISSFSLWLLTTNESNIVYIQICPLSLSLGSENRSFEPLTATAPPSVRLSQLPPPVLPGWVDEQREQHLPWPPQSWKDHAQKKAWRYLLDQSALGNLICVTRGKLMILAAGNVSLVLFHLTQALICLVLPACCCDQFCSRRAHFRIEAGQLLGDHLERPRWSQRGSSES